MHDPGREGQDQASGTLKQSSFRKTEKETGGVRDQKGSDQGTHGLVSEIIIFLLKGEE